MTDVSVSVIVVAKGESPVRMQRMVDCVAASKGAGPIEMLIAAPASDVAGLGLLRFGGAISAVRLLPNPTGERSRGLNLCVNASRGQFICRVDARSLPGPSYIARCIERLRAAPAVAVVGGRQRAVTEEAGVTPRAIARVLRNPWLLGAAPYRRPGACGPADTVYLGAFRRSDIVAIGGWDEQLLANEDYELCQRFTAAGRDIWLEDVDVDYEVRSRLSAVARQYHAFGRSKVAYWRRTGRRPARRQVAAIGAASLFAGAVMCSLTRPRRLAALLVTAAVGLAALDHAADPDERDIRVRAHSLAASAVVVASWLAGVFSGAARSGKR